MPHTTAPSDDGTPREGFVAYVERVFRFKQRRSSSSTSSSKKCERSWCDDDNDDDIAVALQKQQNYITISDKA